MAVARARRIGASAKPRMRARRERERARERDARAGRDGRGAPVVERWLGGHHSRASAESAKSISRPLIFELRDLLFPLFFFVRNWMKQKRHTH